MKYLKIVDEFTNSDVTPQIQKKINTNEFKFYPKKDPFNGYEYVDLGLPSGLLWAKYNIGANSEEEAGLYFQWGDIQGYTAEQVGDGEGLKAFNNDDYKFSIDGSSLDFQNTTTQIIKGFSTQKMTQLM